MGVNVSSLIEHQHVIKNTMLWEVTLCSVVQICQSFHWTWCTSHDTLPLPFSFAGSHWVIYIFFC